MSFVNRKFFGLFALLLMAVGLCLPRAQAQVNYGSVRGLAKDSQGAVIPDAEVTLTSLATKLVRTSKTNGSGEFDFTSVTPGDYEVEVTLKGFKTFKEAVTVDLGSTATVDAALQVGSAGETVEVKTSDALIDTASASAGQSFTSQQLTELPNLGRNPFVFEKLDNNVTPVGDPRYVRAEDQSGSTAVSIAGAPIGANSYVVDGIPTSTSSGGVTFIPSPEAVSDAKTQANTYDAEIGRTGGGVGNTSLKSGTSTYHGTLWGETRQTPWSSNSWTNGHTPYIVNGQQVSTFTPKPDVTTYLYAGAFGGPVPFSDKFKYTKNTFFYITEEGYRQAQPLTGSSTLFVPTPAEATGDFTADVASGGISALYDPTSAFVGGTRSATLADSRCNGTPTSGCIPSSLFNPIGSWIAGNAYPAQTFVGGFGNPNYSKSDDFKTRSDMYSGKLDHTFTPWWSSNVSYVHLATQEPSGDIYGNKGNFSSDAKLIRFNDATALYNVFTINPTTIATVGYGFNRYYSVSFPYGLGFNLASGFGGAGFPASFIGEDQNHFGSEYTFPSITTTNTSSGSTNFAGLGGSFGGRSIASATHNLVVGVQKTVGKQNLKAGYVYRAMHVASNPTGALPAFTFNGAFTSADGKSTSGTSVAKSGNGLADLELGLADSASIGQSIGAFDERANYHALYIQDDFRANDKLTINIGVRYEYELGEREANNQLVVGFDRNVTYTIPTTTVGTLTEGGAIAHGGLAYAGQNGYPVHTANQSHTKFSPRVGIAYEPRKGSVLQAGFGVFYAPEAVSAFTTGYSQSSSYAAGTSGNGNITAAVPAGQVGTGAYLSNPFNGTTTGSLIAPSGNSLGYLTALGGSLSVIDFKRADPVVEQYSVRIEQALPWATALTVGYVGAHSKNFPQSVNINQLPDQQFAQFAATSAAGTPVNYSTAASNNPYYLPTVTSPAGVTYNNPSLLSNPTIASGQLLLPYPQYTSITLSESTGYSLYNAFNIKVQKQAAKGLTVLFAYTWASNWDNLYGGGSSLLGTNGPADNYNLKKEYARAVNDIPNRFTAGITYALPVGRGQRYFSGMSKWLDYAVGGYSVDAIITREDGGAFGITQSTNYGSTYGVSGFGGTERPNLTGTSPCLSGKPGNRTGLNGIQPYYNIAAFSAAQPFTYGNEPRSLPCHGPGLSDTDLNVEKTFSVTERVKIKFIAEALNATNTTQFGFIGSSATTLTSSQPTTGGAKANSTTPAVLQTTPTANTTGALAQINYSRFLQLGGRIIF